MVRPLRVLFVERYAKSADKLVSHLEASGFAPVTHASVQDIADLKDHLSLESWDVVVGNDEIPDLPHTSVVEELRNSGLETPFVATVGGRVFKWVDDIESPDCKPSVDRIEKLGSVISDAVEGSLEKRARRELELQLKQAQKMEAVGQLAAGVAHDFNNLLTAMIGFADLAEEARSPEETKAAILGVRRAVEQATGVTRALLTFSRKRSNSRKTPIHLGKSVSDSIWMLRQIIPAAIDTVSDVQASPDMWIMGDETQIQQVIMNLAVNARDAMEKGGRLLIAVHAIAPRDGGRGEVRLIVEDNGTGISEELQARLFDPFFTTKPRGFGTGLGLSVVHGILTDHGGRIRVQSEIGIGTRIELTFPKCDVEAPKEPLPNDRRPIELPKGKRVLLAEDNPLVQDVIGDALERKGFLVVRTADGRNVIEELEEDGGRFVLAILDVDLPGREGSACLAEARSKYPHLPIIMITGSPRYDLPENHDLVTYLLRKPFSVRRLLQTIQLALNPELHSISSNGRNLDAG